MSELERIGLLYDIIRKQIKRTLFEKIKDILKIERAYKMEAQIDISLVIRNMIANRFRMYESIFTEKEKKGKNGLYSANLSLVCQKYCISPHDLYKNYTLEQYLWMLDGVIYQMNEMSEE